MLSRVRLPATAAALATAALLAPATASAFDPAVEAQNFSKGNERSAIYNTPEYRALLIQVSAQNNAAVLAIQASDPERQFNGQLCATGTDGCAGDARLYDWQAKGYGIVQPVLFTARNGATISGKVWATRAGPAKRPGIVITNGSVQAPEQLYWFVAQVLAKSGYVVLTSDPQNQGQSDGRGEAPDQNEGFPAQSDGRPFFDGTVDALNFFLSTPQSPYVPVKSCETGTSHAPKHNRRVNAGLNAAYNPFHSLLDPGRIGLAGHSYGASGISYVGQADPRVDAIVALDNLADADPNGSGVGSARPCPSDPAARKPAEFTKPALGISADYFIPPTPNTSDPDPLAKSVNSFAYSGKGVDTGELIIRGGTHYDFDWIPHQGFPATLRGADMIDWYTTAWFDRYVKGGDATADRRLRTDRWRRDAQEGAVDPNKDANMFSFYYRSRLDIGRAGPTRFTCEDMRPGCAGLTADDGVQGDYDWFSIARSPDRPGAGSSLGSQGLGVCTSRRRIVIHVKRRRGLRIRRVVAYVGKRKVGQSRSRRVSVRLIGLPRQIARVQLRITARQAGKTVRLTRHRTYRTCVPKRKTLMPSRP